MSRFLSRLFTAHKEEALLISIKVYEIELATSCKMEGIYVEWIRGDTVEHSGPLGFVNTIRNTLSCNHKFEKLSIFYKNVAAEGKQEGYLEKWCTLRVMATSGDVQGKYPIIMGECTFDLAQFIQKKEKKFKFPLSVQSQLRGEIKLELSIQPEHVAKQAEMSGSERVTSGGNQGAESIQKQMGKVTIAKNFNDVSIQTEALKQPAPIIQVKEVVKPDPEMEAQLAQNMARIKELEQLIKQKNAEIEEVTKKIQSATEHQQVQMDEHYQESMPEAS